MTVTNMHTAFKAKLANSQDTYVLKDTLFLNSTTSSTAGTPTSLILLNPTSFGTRPNAVAALYTHFKILELRFRFTAYSLANNTVSIGVLDDATATEGDIPTSFAGVQALRCSGIFLEGTTVPEEFVYRPIRGQQPLFTGAGASGSDARLVNQGVLVVAGLSASQPFSIVVDYVIRFEGASDVGAN
jgi:hypothetical protein